MFWSIGRRFGAGVGFFGFLLALVYAWKFRVGLKVLLASLVEAIAVASALSTAIAVGLYLGIGASLFRAASWSDIISEYIFCCVVLTACLLPIVLNIECVRNGNASAATVASEAQTLVPESPQAKVGIIRRVGSWLGWGAKQAIAVSSHVIAESGKGIREGWHFDEIKVHLPKEFRPSSLLPLAVLIAFASFAALPLNWAIGVAALSGIQLLCLGRVLHGSGSKLLAVVAFMTATGFGSVYGIHLSSRLSDTTIMLQDGSSLRGTVAFNVWSGPIMLRPEINKVQLVPWPRVASMEYDRTAPPIDFATTSVSKAYAFFAGLLSRDGPPLRTQ